MILPIRDIIAVNETMTGRGRDRSGEEKRMIILLIIILIGIIGGIALVSRYNWHSNMGRNMGKKRMEEYGLLEEEEKYHE